MNFTFTLHTLGVVFAGVQNVSTGFRIGLLVGAYVFGMLVGQTALAIGML